MSYTASMLRFPGSRSSSSSHRLGTISSTFYFGCALRDDARHVVVDVCQLRIYDMKTSLRMPVTSASSLYLCGNQPLGRVHFRTNPP